MRLKGYFASCVEKVFTKRDGTEGRKIVCMFHVDGERDEIELSVWQSRGLAWCKENGVTTGAAGEVNARFGTNDYGWYEQVIMGFKTQAQIEAEKAEKEKKASVPAPQEKTPEMQAAAEAKMAAAQADPEAEDDLPF